MSLVLPWEGRADARAAAGRPAHDAAAALTHETYAEYRLEFHRVRRLPGAAGFRFEPYDTIAEPARAMAAADQALPAPPPLPNLDPQLAPP